MEKFPFHLISPERTVFKGLVDRVILPGTEGEFGILAHHSNFVSTLKPGLIHIQQSIDGQHYVYTREGFACINEKGCTVLAQDCFFIEEIDLADLQKVISQKQQEIDRAQTEAERAALQRDLQMMALKHKIIENHRGL